MAHARSTQEKTKIIKDDHKEIQEYLEGAVYPASKYELINRARDNDAPDSIINELKAMPEDHHYTSAQDVKRTTGHA